MVGADFPRPEPSQYLAARDRARPSAGAVVRLHGEDREQEKAGRGSRACTYPPTAGAADVVELAIPAIGFRSAAPSPFFTKKP